MTQYKNVSDMRVDESYERLHTYNIIDMHAVLFVVLTFTRYII